MKEDKFILFAIYKNPSDYPGKFVVRKWTDNKPALNPTCVVDSVEEARAFIPQGLVYLPLATNDDPVIVETYI